MIDAHLHLQDPRLLSEADTIVETCREVVIFLFSYQLNPIEIQYN